MLFLELFKSVFNWCKDVQSVSQLAASANDNDIIPSICSFYMRSREMDIEPLIQIPY